MKTKSRDINGANVSPLRFLRIYSWDQVKRLDIIDNAFPHHPLVNFLPLKQDYSLTTKLLMRALKRKLFWVSSHDLRWGNKTTSKYCRCLVSASNKIKYKWLELSCINGNRSFQGLPVFCWSNYTFKNKHVGLVSRVNLMLTHSFPIKCQELATFKKISLNLYSRVFLWKKCQNCFKPNKKISRFLHYKPSWLTFFSKKTSISTYKFFGLISIHFPYRISWKNVVKALLASF